MALTETLVLGVAVDAITLTDAPTGDEVCQIGDIVYTWKASPSSANEVDIGGSSAVSAANLIAAINDAGTEGTTYGTGTVANPYVTAEEGGTTSKITLTARVAGDWVNALHLSADGDTSVDANSFGGVDESGSVDGSGSLPDAVDSLIEDNQVNSEVISHLRALTAAAD